MDADGRMMPLPGLLTGRGVDFLDRPLISALVDTWESFARDANGVPQHPPSELLALRRIFRWAAEDVPVYAGLFSQMTGGHVSGLALARKYRDAQRPK